MKYFICWGKTPDNLTDCVNEILSKNKDWKLYGNPFFGSLSPVEITELVSDSEHVFENGTGKFRLGDSRFCQALVFDDKKE